MDYEKLYKHSIEELSCFYEELVFKNMENIKADNMKACKVDNIKIQLLCDVLLKLNFIKLKYINEEKKENGK